jgi:hypothetical protein
MEPKRLRPDVLQYGTVTELDISSIKKYNPEFESHLKHSFLP